MADFEDFLLDPDADKPRRQPGRLFDSQLFLVDPDTGSKTRSNLTGYITSGKLVDDPTKLNYDPVFHRLSEPSMGFFSHMNELKEKHPNLYVYGSAAMQTGVDIGNWAIDLVPGAKYARTKDADRWDAMSPWEKTKAVAYEGLGLFLWGPALFPRQSLQLAAKTARFGAKTTFRTAKAAGRGAAKTGEFAYKTFREDMRAAGRRAGRTAPAAKPIFDRAKDAWKPMTRKEMFDKWAKSKGYSQARAEQAFQYMHKETTAVRDSARAMAEEYMTTRGSDAFTMNNFTRHIQKDYNKLKETFKQWKGDRFKKFGKDAKIENATDDVMKDFMVWMITDSPESLATIQKARRAEALIGEDLWGFVSLYPIRFVMGAGEPVFQTWSKVYRPIQAGYNAQNQYTAKRLLSFHEMLYENGLFTKTAKGKLKPLPILTDNIKRQTHRAISTIDNYMESARQGTTKALTVEQASARVGEVLNKWDVTFPVVRRLIDAWYEYADLLYYEHTFHRMRKIFDDAGLSVTGVNSMDIFFEERVRPLLADVFTTSRAKDATTKVSTVEELIALAQTEAETNAKVLFQEPNVGLRHVKNRLKYGTDDGIMPYLEYYTARFMRKEFKDEMAAFRLMAPKNRPFYTHERNLAQALGRFDDFDSMVYIRTRAQAKEMFYADTLAEVAGHVNKMSDSYKEFISHWIARLHGVPSQLDHQLADVLQKVLPGEWNARRIYGLTRTVNDLTYMGILGFKPFSAMRNLFQPAITLPPTLGAPFLKSWQNVLLGYNDLFNPEIRAILKEMDIITDYAPELMRISGVTKIPKAVTVAGKSFTMPTSAAMRDAAMWMFSGADKINRYVSGSAALRAWEEGIIAAGGKTAPLGEIMAKTYANKRGQWIVAEIRDLLSKGNFDEARKIFVQDVVGGSQWLYGPLDAPIVSQKFGSLGRQASVFQSWWMNYGANLEQWMKTGKGPGGSTERMFNWMLSNAIVATIMATIWGKGTAVRSTFLGPFHGVTGAMEDPYKAIMMVPAWRPIIQSFELTARAAGLLVDPSKRQQRRVVSQSKALTKTVFNFFPGGSIAQQTGSKLFLKKEPGLVPTNWEIELAIKEFFGVRSY